MDGMSDLPPAPRRRDLADLADRIGATRVRGEAAGPIDAIRYDSRQAGPGALFVARPGTKDDGHRFIADAVRRGARAVIHERDLPGYAPGVCYLQVPDAPTALAVAGAWHAGDPARDLVLVGVTGTDGKSSTAWFTKLLLDRLGVPAGLVSSVYVDDGTGVVDTPWRLSTPEAPELHGLLATMAGHARRAAVIEATSIALAAGRVHALPLAAAAITNVTHEHLEFHGDWERYRDAKAALLDMLVVGPDGSRGVAVLNREDAAWEDLSARFPAAQSFGTAAAAPRSGDGADCTATVLAADGSGLTLAVRLHAVRRRCRVRVGDPVQAGNIAAACLLASGVTGAAADRVLDALPVLSPLPGRMQQIANDRGFTMIVDHAHTPAAFEQLFAGLRVRRAAEDAADGRIIVVFGSAGEKDRQKRAMQGRIASEHADVVILADEDPRREDPLLILRDIAGGFVPGAPAPTFIPDRREAIGAAVELARPGDTVLLLGKGHEHSMEYADHVQPWDEVGEACLALQTHDSTLSGRAISGVIAT